MVSHSDALSDFIDMTMSRFLRDRDFRLRLLAEADETPRETAYKIRRESMIAAQRRTAS
ncbi:hypothetical protein QE375_001618 [Microbacterium foliorum]|uniref:Uncharacterized protein n=1 Tax=Microbacterium foliorum TaxID=104336 RepID=A0ABU1HRW9_9MICO|nr:hypothetical protein [Microbacterium foliorum]